MGPFKSDLNEAIDRATSELLPGAQEDLQINLTISDAIQGRQVNARDAVRAMRRRLTHHNPNVQMLTFKLLDTCIKNSGHHFLLEVASRDFTDAVAQLLRNSKTHPDVIRLGLDLFQQWALAFRSKPDLVYLSHTYDTLLNVNRLPFPPVPVSSIPSSTVLETACAPVWQDSPVCVRCRSEFTLTNRKHHCRACGLCFCQPCSSRTLAVPQLGITLPARVCDGCFVKYGGSVTGPTATQSNTGQFPGAIGQDVGALAAREEDELQRAIRLSLEESKQNLSGSSINAPASMPKSVAPEDDDPMLAAAIKASLAETKSSSIYPVSQGQVVGNPSNPTPVSVPIAPIANEENLNAFDLDRQHVALFNALLEKLLQSPPNEAAAAQRTVQDMFMQLLMIRDKTDAQLTLLEQRHVTLNGQYERLVQALQNYDQLLEKGRPGRNTASPVPATETLSQPTAVASYPSVQYGGYYPPYPYYPAPPQPGMEASFTAPPAQHAPVHAGYPPAPYYYETPGTLPPTGSTPLPPQGLASQQVPPPPSQGPPAPSEEAPPLIQF